MFKIKIAMKYSLLLLLMLVSNCSKKECLFEYEDKRSYNSYFISADTCSKETSVFQENKLYAKGLGDRLNKNGHWEYFENKKIIASGDYNQSQPLGNWNYGKKNIGWSLIDTYENYFIISVPNGLQLISEPNYDLTYMSKDSNFERLNVAIKIRDYNKPLSQFYKEIEQVISNQNLFTYSDYKIIPTETKNEIIERRAEYLQNGKKIRLIEAAYGITKSKKSYTLFIEYEIDDKSNLDLVSEQILESFKISSEIW